MPGSRVTIFIPLDFLNSRFPIRNMSLKIRIAIIYVNKKYPFVYFVLFILVCTSTSKNNRMFINVYVYIERAYFHSVLFERPLDE